MGLRTQIDAAQIGSRGLRFVDAKGDAFFLRGQQRFFIGEALLARELRQVRRIDRNAALRLQPGGKIGQGDVGFGHHLLEDGLPMRAELARPSWTALSDADRAGSARSAIQVLGL